MFREVKSRSWAVLGGEKKALIFYVFLLAQHGRTSLILPKSNDFLTKNRNTTTIKDTDYGKRTLEIPTRRRNC
jgi:hypothetical protein